MQNLVIVESPAKAKTIGKYLGRDYEVRASMGHLRDLPKSTLGVDVEHDFEPDYRPIQDRADLIKELKTAAGKADTVYLATDPDREGEAISWHLKALLELPDEKARRVTFNEITKKVVQESIRAPREIDQNLVDAQQARRILDRLVGYKLSPLLWKKIRRGLSAGRVQSVATRMVDDREHEIEDFHPEEYWTLDAALLTSPGGALLTARFHGKDGKKMELPDRETVDTVIQETTGVPFTVQKVKRSDKRKNPAPPFTTSTLQQDASRKLNMSPRRTMAVAQQLYEGVEISGEGAVGLITYMRTDSLRLSEEAIAAARELITSRYGAAYCPEKPVHYRSKSNAQDAHEAIRPSDVFRTPEQIKSDLTREQYALYRLIWSRFVACQMASAVYDSVSAEIAAGAYDFRASASSLKFAGYTAVYEEGRDDEKSKISVSASVQKSLAALTEGQPLLFQSYDPQQHFTQPPARYTDAALIRAMEEQGIGRPSTYAPTITTILDRQYVAKEGKYLRITNLGRVVTELMKERFSDIADLRFTARMEEELDNVEAGKTPWKSVLRDFYGNFDASLQTAEKELEGVRIKVPDEVTQEICPVCGKNLVIKRSRFGPFMACPGFPECTFTMPLVQVMPGRCPKCGGRLMKRTGVSQGTGKPYTYYCCEHQVATKNTTPTCDFRTWDVPTEDDCPVCGQTMFKRQGRGSRKAFCINPECSNFTPEDKRGYFKKTVKDDTGESSAAETDSAEDVPDTEASAGKKKTPGRTVAKKSATSAKAKTTKSTASAKSKTTTSAKSKTAKSAKSVKSKTAKSAAEKSGSEKKSTARKRTSKTTAQNGGEST